MCPKDYLQDSFVIGLPTEKHLTNKWKGKKMKGPTRDNTKATLYIFQRRQLNKISHLSRLQGYNIHVDSGGTKQQRAAVTCLMCVWTTMMEVHGTTR